MSTRATGMADQGVRGNRLAASLADYRIEVPHAGSNNDDLCSISRLRMARHDYLTKCYQGEASVRDMGTGKWFELEGHPDIDRHPVEERRFVIIAQQIAARNNLPKEIDAKVTQLFAANGWGADETLQGGKEAGRYRSRFTCVRRGVAIVPAFDPLTDLLRPQLQSAIVVGPPGEEVHCDAYGRVKVRFPGTRPADHVHASGAGAADADNDSAWVRVASNWAGDGPGSQHQCGAHFLPRVNSEVLIDFMGGDPDRPVIVGQLYNMSAAPPALSALGALPGNKYLSGMRSREVRGARANILRLDDTPGQISARLASDHGASALNLGWLTQERFDGEGAPRGEGAELRSDKAVAVRARQGILLSTSSGSDAGAAQLERENLIGMAEAANDVTQQLSELATAHSVASAEGDELGNLLDCVRHWHSGSNTGQGEAEAGGRPILAASAEAGMLLASQNNLALGAQTRIDIASVADTQLSAGHSLFLRAARGLNLIAFKLGMKLVAAGGDLRIEAHDGDIVITCPKKIRIVAGKGIDIEALAVKVVAQGAQVDFGGGAITQQSSGPHTIKSSCFDQLGAGDAAPEGVKLPISEMKHDQRVQLTDQVSFEPAPNRKYRVTTEDGNVLEGVSDAKGMTERFANKPGFAHYKIELLD
jgi:type VI secretion system secreted protein VgrG